MFEAYITNTALYPLMGIGVGTTVHFPMTTQELCQPAAVSGKGRKPTTDITICLSQSV